MNVNGFGLAAVCVAIFAAGCGGAVESTITVDPCSSDDASASCIASCGSDVDCGTGTFCRAGRCEADCTVEGGECGPGAHCTASGRCALDANVDAGSEMSDAAVLCADVELRTERVIPNIMILLDQSGSMGNRLGNTRKWQAMVDAINSLVPRLESVARFGLQTYNEATGACPPEGTRVDVSLDNAAAIADQLAMLRPSGGTPTAFALEILIGRLIHVPPPPGPNVFVLATDGLPNACGSTDPWPGANATVSSVQHAFNIGVKTFALGIAFNNEHLQQVANAGVGVAPGQPDAPWWTANDVDSLRYALEQIVTNQIPCEVDVQGRIDPRRACDGKVTLDGEVLACEDQMRGWRPVTESSIELLGTACDDWRTGDQRTLLGSFPCDIIVE